MEIHEISGGIVDTYRQRNLTRLNQRVEVSYFYLSFSLLFGVGSLYYDGGPVALLFGIVFLWLAVRHATK